MQPNTHTHKHPLYAIFMKKMKNEILNVEKLLGAAMENPRDITLTLLDRQIQNWKEMK